MQEFAGPFEIPFVYLSNHLGPPDGCILCLGNRRIGETGIFTDATPGTDIQVVPHGSVELRSKKIKQLFFFLFFHYPALSDTSFSYFALFIKNRISPDSCSVFKISLPLVRAQAGKSERAPGSVVTASKIWPTSISLIPLFTLITGWGQGNPFKSIVLLTLISSLMISSFSNFLSSPCQVGRECGNHMNQLAKWKKDEDKVGKQDMKDQSPFGR